MVFMVIVLLMAVAASGRKDFGHSDSFQLATSSRGRLRLVLESLAWDGEGYTEWQTDDAVVIDRRRERIMRRGPFCFFVSFWTTLSAKDCRRIRFIEALTLLDGTIVSCVVVLSVVSMRTNRYVESESEYRKTCLIIL